jgi:hypothetical protein
VSDTGFKYLNSNFGKCGRLWNSCSDTEQLYSNVCKYYGRLGPIIFWGSTNYTFLELEEQYLTWNNLNSNINKYPGRFSSLLCFWERTYQPHIILEQGEQ